MGYAKRNLRDVEDMAVSLDVDLVDLDTIRVSPPTARSPEAGPDGLEVLVFGPHVDGDGEIIQDFWPV